jgi:cytochrome c-type biogenesis protein CcmH/NrfF
MNYARMDFKMLFQKLSIKEIWMPNHITRMMGAMIASYTAFLVVNIKMKPDWVLWVLPTLVGSVLISYFLKKFVPRKSAKSV